MKKLVTLFALLVVSAFAATVDLSKPIATVRLNDGRILKNVTLQKFNAETVLMRTHMGPVTARYEALPDDVRSAAEQRRPGGAKWFAGDTSGNTEAVEGQIFVQTQGNSSYKFGNVEVYAFDLATLQYFEQGEGAVRLPRPIHVTTTDADGKFSLRVPKDRAYFVLADASRLMVSGLDSYTERHQWRVPMSAIRQGKPLLLNQDNRAAVRRPVVFDPVD